MHAVGGHDGVEEDPGTEVAGEGRGELGGRGGPGGSGSGRGRRGSGGVGVDVGIRRRRRRRRLHSRRAVSAHSCSPSGLSLLDAAGVLFCHLARAKQIDAARAGEERENEREADLSPKRKKKNSVFGSSGSSFFSSSSSRAKRGHRLSPLLSVLLSGGYEELARSRDSNPPRARARSLPLGCSTGPLPSPLRPRTSRELRKLLFSNRDPTRR